MIPKPAPARFGYGYCVRYELCRGEIVGRSGEERCSFCGARPVWA